jgi:hypothetical protein
MPVNVNDVVNSLMGASGASSAAKSQVTAAYGDLKSTLNDTAQAELDAGDSKAIIAKQLDVGELQAQNNARRAATAMGTNMDDVSQIVTQVGQQLRDSAVQLNKQTAVVADMESNNNLLSNPLGFMYDLLYGDEQRSKLDGLKSEFDTARKTLAGLNEATQQTAVTQSKLAQTKSAATISANQDLIASNAQIAANKAKTDVAKADVNLINNLDNLTSSAAARAAQAYTIQAHAEQMGWMREEKESAKRTLDASMELYNAGAEALGAPPIKTKDEFKLQQSLNKPRLDYIMMSGMSLKAKAEGQDTGPVPYGRTPLDAMKNIVTMRLPVSPGTEDLLLQTQRLAGGAGSQQQVEDMLIATGQAKDKKSATQMSLSLMSDKKNLPQLQANFISWQVSNMAKEPMTGNEHNIYNTSSLDFLAGKSEMTNNPFLAKYVSPLVQTGGTGGPDTKLIELGVQATIKDSIPQDQVVAGLKYIGDQIKLHNNTLKNYKSVGLPIQTKVNVPISIRSGSLFSTDINRTVDLSDAQDINSVLVDARTKIVAKQRKAEFTKEAIGRKFAPTPGAPLTSSSALFPVQ